MREGAVCEDLVGWNVRCLICVAEDDLDFFDQARRAADEMPDAEFVPIPGKTTSVWIPPTSSRSCLRC